MQVIVAHGPGGGLGLLAFVPVGFLLLVGLVLMFSPVVSQSGRPVPKEDEDDLANQLLGEEGARELRRRARRKRAVRRRTRRAGSGRQGPGGGDHGWH
ncbi:MAG TPA: hypothetical protein VGC06_25065 [Actinomycetes bacterium]